ncbi:hypothetical protein Z043_118694 [Scleropages formosus]|uniref:Ig-like domain-containing protein n=1 Tax=Scleropages formosus TaxID=113540 RepID=A0A0P7WP62_SCLFO|nr:hypothetical protein Z043_118694 [Scleropages formosus]
MKMMMLLGVAAFVLCLCGAKASDEVVAVPTEVFNATTAILTCNLTNPSSTVKGHFWAKNNKMIENTQKESSDLHMEYKLEKIDSTTGGIYACTFRTANGELEKTIEVKTLPHVSAPKHSEHSIENDKGVLVCVSHGYPLPTDWTWYKLDDSGKKELNNMTDKYEIKSTPNKTTLYIMDLKIETDVGKYQCLGKNEFGSVEDTIHLRVRSRLAALWPFLGIVVEVIILITVIFIYEKRRKPDEIGDGRAMLPPTIRTRTSGRGTPTESRLQTTAAWESLHVELRSV